MFTDIGMGYSRHLGRNKAVIESTWTKFGLNTFLAHRPCNSQVSLSALS